MAKKIWPTPSLKTQASQYRDECKKLGKPEPTNLEIKEKFINEGKWPNMPKVRSDNKTDKSDKQKRPTDKKGKGGSGGADDPIPTKVTADLLERNIALAIHNNPGDMVPIQKGLDLYAKRHQVEGDTGPDDNPMVGEIMGGLEARLEKLLGGVTPTDNLEEIDNQ
jgi:hypothetical protein